jgi:hypothetical protein
LKYRLVITFGLGMLAGILLWSNGTDTHDSGQQSADTPKVSATQGRLIRTGPKPRSYTPWAEPAPLDRGQMPQYGMVPARPENGSTEWERSGQYGYWPPSDPRRSWGAAFAKASDTGAALSYAPPYDYPMYSNVQVSTGYRFRPLDAASDSGNGRRYTGNYPRSRHPSRRTATPRWNESPAYWQPQPRRRSIPAFENQPPYFQLPSGHLYSAR